MALLRALPLDEGAAVPAEGEEQLGGGEHEVLVGDDLLGDHHALAGEDSREPAGLDLVPAYDDGRVAGVLDQDQPLVAEGGEPLARIERFDDDIAGRLVGNRQNLQRLVALRHPQIGWRILFGIQLVDEIDRLRGDPELVHEDIEGLQVLAALLGFRDQHEQLDA